MTVRSNGGIRRQSVERQIDNLTRELARLDALPAEPDAEPGIITFDRVIGGRTFSYAAVRADGVWYYTGRDRDGTFGLTWERLMEKLADWRVTEIWLATVWEQVT